LSEDFDCLKLTHRQTPLMNDGAEKNRMRGSVDDVMMMSKMTVVAEM